MKRIDRLYLASRYLVWLRILACCNSDNTVEIAVHRLADMLRFDPFQSHGFGCVDAKLFPTQLVEKEEKISKVDRNFDFPTIMLECN
jgi:hypothetical protein